jgi:hypothetical protein
MEKELEPVRGRYSLRVGKTYRMKSRLKEKKGGEIILKVVSKNSSLYTFVVLAVSSMSEKYKERYKRNPKYETYMNIKGCNKRKWRIWEWYLEEKDLPIYVTWGFCCNEFVEKLRGPNAAI